MNVTQGLSLPGSFGLDPASQKVLTFGEGNIDICGLSLRFSCRIPHLQVSQNCRVVEAVVDDEEAKAENNYSEN